MLIIPTPPTAAWFACGASLTGKDASMFPISKMASMVQPSATLAAGAKARQLKAEGKQVFDFSVGEPDFPTPDHICQAAFQAMKEGHTHYTPAAGIPELRAAIAKTYRQAGLEVSPEQIIVSNGAKHSLHNAIATMVGPGDEVIIPAPYWVSYSDLVQMTGASFVLVPTNADNRFKLTPDQLRRAVTKRSRVLMLNSPGNPTGSVYSQRELEAIADVVLDSDLAVISDEIYEKLVFGTAKATCFATLRRGLPERTITISGVSKSYAMTGWRMGWAVGPLTAIRTMGNIQSQQTSSPSSISQYAALAALEGDQQCVESMRREFEARRDLVCKRLAELPGIRCPTPDGAFYAFFDINAHLGRVIAGHKIADSVGFCQAALEAAHVNLVPGAAFGTEGYARMSFAASRQQLNGGLDRLGEFLGE
jgi:aspartate aminotransferase